MRKTITNKISLVMCITIYTYFFVNYPVYLPSQRSIQAPRTPFGEITLMNSLVQTIKIAKQQTISKIEILLATYARSNSNITTIEVFKDGVNYYSNKINSSTIKDNSYFEISRIEIPVKENDLLEIMIYSDDAVTGNAITAWINNNQTTNNLRRLDKITNTSMEVNGEIDYILYDNLTLLSKYVSSRFIGNSQEFLFISGLTFILLLNLLFELLFKTRSENYETDYTNPMF